MMNQNMKSFKKALSTATCMLGKAFEDNTEYRSWCYASRITSISPAMRTW